MIKYTGTKEVLAKPMDRLTYCQYRGWALPQDEDGSDQGYLVEYTDGGKPNVEGHAGYISWSPKGVFERSYKAQTQTNQVQADFGIALMQMKKGGKVARHGWNGKGMFVFIVPGGVQSGLLGDGEVEHNPYFAIKNVNGSISTWVPSVNDCMANDWVQVA